MVHNYRLDYPELPGISVIKKDRNNGNVDKVDVIPFELLEVVEAQFYRRKLEPDVQKRVQNLSTCPPRDRKNTILTHLTVSSSMVLVRRVELA